MKLWLKIGIIMVFFLIKPAYSIDLNLKYLVGSTYENNILMNSNPNKLEYIYLLNSPFYSSINQTNCYQEQSNISTGYTDLLDICDITKPNCTNYTITVNRTENYPSFFCSMNYIGAYNYTDVNSSSNLYLGYDNNYSTYSSDQNFTFYVNYTKPPYSTSNSLWIVKYDKINATDWGAYSIPIKIDCWNNGNILQFQIKRYSARYPNPIYSARYNITELYCKNSTDWVDLGSSSYNTYEKRFYEESMYWNITRTDNYFNGYCYNSLNGTNIINNYYSTGFFSNGTADHIPVFVNDTYLRDSSFEAYNDDYQSVLISNYSQNLIMLIRPNTSFANAMFFATDGSSVFYWGQFQNDDENFTLVSGLSAVFKISTAGNLWIKNNLYGNSIYSSTLYESGSSLVNKYIQLNNATINTYITRNISNSSTYSNFSYFTNYMNNISERNLFLNTTNDTLNNYIIKNISNASTYSNLSNYTNYMNNLTERTLFLNTTNNSYNDYIVANISNMSKYCNEVINISTKFRSEGNLSQMIPNGVLTIVNVSNETFDTLSEFDNTTQRGRFTPKTTGYYMFIGGLRYASPITPSCPHYVMIVKNGADQISVQGFTSGASTGSMVLQTSTMYYLTTTDYIELGSYHTCGGYENVSTNNPFQTFLSGYRVF